MTLMHRNQPGLNLLQGKWLDQVIVGTAIETLKLIVQGVSCGKHQHRRINVLFLSQFPAQCDTVHARQTKVKQNSVKILRCGKMQSRNSIASSIYTVSAGLQEIVKI